MMEARTPFKMQLLQGYVKFWSVGNLTFLHEEKANSAMIYIYFDDKGWACCRYSKQIPWVRSPTQNTKNDGMTKQSHVLNMFSCILNGSIPCLFLIIDSGFSVVESSLSI